MLSRAPTSALRDVLRRGRRSIEARRVAARVVVSLDAGQTVEAEALSRRLLRLRPGQPNALRLAGRVAAARGDREQVLERLSCVAPDELDDDERSMLRRARLHHAAQLRGDGALSAAATVVATVLATDPTDHEGWMEAAELAERRGDHREAVRCWRAAIDHGDRCMTAEEYARVHRLLIRLGDLDEAEELIAEAMRRYPASVRLLVLHARLAERTSNWRDAVASWQRVSDARSGRLRAAWYRRYGRACRHLGDWDRADRIVAEGRRQYPAVLDLLIEHARIASGRGDPTLAIERWEEVLRRTATTDLQHRRAIQKLAQELRRCGRHEDAEATLEPLLSAPDPPASALFLHAKLAALRKEWRLAEQRWRRYVAHVPTADDEHPELLIATLASSGEMSSVLRAHFEADEVVTVEHHDPRDMRPRLLRFHEVRTSSGTRRCFEKLVLESRGHREEMVNTELGEPLRRAGVRRPELHLAHRPHPHLLCLVFDAVAGVQTTGGARTHLGAFVDQARRLVDVRVPRAVWAELHRIDQATPARAPLQLIQRLTTSDWSSTTAWERVFAAFESLGQLPPQAALRAERLVAALDPVHLKRSAARTRIGLTHFDMDPVNVLVDRSGEVTIIDWADAGVAPFGHDLAHYAAEAGCTYDEFLRDVVDPFLSGTALDDIAADLRSNFALYFAVAGIVRGGGFEDTVDPALDHYRTLVRW